MRFVIPIILFIIAAALFVLSILQFNEKGLLLNNAYLFSSEQERKTMDKKPHYRQSGVIFGLLGVMFLLIALEMLFKTGWLYFIVLAIVFVTIAYAIASSIKDAANSRKR